MRRSSLRWTIPTFLALQLGLLWIQGAQLHRQNQVLQGLRDDIQALADSLEDSQSPAANADDTTSVPVDDPSGHAPGRKVAALQAAEDQDPAAKELQASRDSARQAVKEARETQAKLSIEENIRKVEEAKKVQTATNAWQGWAWAAVALVALALMARAWIRRRA